MLPLDCGQPFDSARDEEFFAALPARPAVFLIEPKQSGAQPHFGQLKPSELQLVTDWIKAGALEK